MELNLRTKLKQLHYSGKYSRDFMCIKMLKNKTKKYVIDISSKKN